MGESDLLGRAKEGVSMKFSENLWQLASPIYQNIIDHPFNTELAEGTLDERRFLFYMEQDASYLVSFSKALALIAARSVSTHKMRHFLNFSLGALIAERELHANFLPKGYNFDRAEPSPSCIAYAQYLIAMAATASLEEAVAAVLPCFWIYREVGRDLATRLNKESPYARWIETYSGEEYSQGTDQAILLLDDLAAGASPTTLERMIKAFEYSALYEWLFWDDAYNMRLFKEQPFIVVKSCC